MSTTPSHPPAPCNEAPRHGLWGVFAFAGTRSRGAYLRFALAAWVWTVVCVGLLDAASMMKSLALGLLTLGALLPLMWASYAVASQRCRDAGLSAWLIGLFLVPFLNSVFAIALMLWPSRHRQVAAAPLSGTVFDDMWRFSGRRGRQRFIQHRLLGWVVMILCFAFSSAGGLASVLALGVLLAAWASLAAVTTQRLRDLGLNGWWVLALVFLGPIGAIALMLPPGQAPDNGSDHETHLVGDATTTATTGKKASSS